MLTRPCTTYVYTFTIIHRVTMTYFVLCLCQLVFTTILWLKLLEMFVTVVLLKNFVDKLIIIIDISLNKLIQFYSNNTLNVRLLTLQITLCLIIPTKWRSCREHRLCDVTSPYMYEWQTWGAVLLCRLTFPSSHPNISHHFPSHQTCL